MIEFFESLTINEEFPFSTLEASLLTYISVS